MRKILVRAPQSLGQQASSLTALNYLYHALGSSCIEVVVNEGKRHLYEYVDVVDKVHAIPEEKNGVLSVFPWVHMNSNIFGIDCFIDLCGGAAAASMGIALKARERIGFATALTKPMFTRSLSGEKVSDFSDERILALCELLLEEKAPAVIRGRSPEASEKEYVQIQSLDDFIFVAVRASEWSRHQAIWEYWLGELSGGNVVVAIDQDIEEELGALIWFKKNQNSRLMLIEKTGEHTDLLLMAAARGILTDSDLYANIAPYYGLTSAVLAFDLNDYPSFALSSPRALLFLERDQNVTAMISTNGERVDIDLSSSVDALFKIFSL